MKRTSAVSLLAVATAGAVIGLAAPSHAAGADNYPPTDPSSSKTTSVLGTQFTAAPVTAPGVAPSTNTSSLPTTGADIAGYTVVGVALLAAGAGAVTAGRRRGNHR